jgi:glycosyltransferase involved in cell wall biosynthesis
MKTVAVVIPSRNEEQHIAKCLDSICDSSYPKEFLQVVVCDGNSTDHTVSIVKEYVSKYEFISLLYNDKQTTPYALNLGLHNTQTDFVMFLDAHSYIDPEFINISVHFLEENPAVSCVGGVVQNVCETSDSWIIGFVLSQPFGVGSNYFQTGKKEGFVETIIVGMYRRQIFENIGDFDVNLVRDQTDDFHFRMKENGYKIYLSKKIRSYYYVRSSFHKFSLQYYQFGYWRVYNNVKHRQITTFRQLVPFFFSLFLISGLLSSLFSFIAAIIYFGVLLIYLIMALMVSFRKKMSIKQRIKTVYCFMLLHISYGIGYANGIGDFLINREKPDRKMGSLTR